MFIKDKWSCEADLFQFKCVFHKYGKATGELCQWKEGETIILYIIFTVIKSKTQGGFHCGYLYHVGCDIKVTSPGKPSTNTLGWGNIDRNHKGLIAMSDRGIFHCIPHTVEPQDRSVVQTEGEWMSQRDDRPLVSQAVFNCNHYCYNWPRTRQDWSISAPRAPNHLCLSLPSPTRWLLITLWGGWGGKSVLPHLCQSEQSHSQHHPFPVWPRRALSTWQVISNWMKGVIQVLCLLVKNCLNPASLLYTCCWCSWTLSKLSCVECCSQVQDILNTLLLGLRTSSQLCFIRSRAPRGFLPNISSKVENHLRSRHLFPNCTCAQMYGSVGGIRFYVDAQQGRLSVDSTHEYELIWCPITCTVLTMCVT